MLVIGGDAVGSNLARGDGLDLKQYPTERRSYAEIMHEREVDTRNRFFVKARGSRNRIPGEYERGWASGGVVGGGKHVGTLAEAWWRRLSEEQISRAPV